MARFRERTTDHDGDGKMGGSLKAGTRFVKGTTDHDNDGRMGGSLKGDGEMAAKKPTKKTTAQKADEARANPDATKAEKKAATEAQFAEADAKGDPAAEHEALQVQRQVRGW